MPNLSDYTTATQQLLHDSTGSLYGSLTNYINEARMRLALQSECVRFLWTFNTATFGQVGGSYTAGNNTINGPGTGTVLGSTIFSDDGLNDFAPGTVVTAVTGPSTITVAPAPLRTASGATLTIYPPLQTAVGQEAYYYNGSVQIGNPLLASFGLQSIVQIKSVAVNWGGISGSSLVMLEQWSFTKYQAFLGYYGVNLQGNPAVWTSYQNTVKMRPVPSSQWPMQWDTICQPIPLTSNTDVEAIPYPYTDSVKYYAAYLALMNSQNPSNADRMLTLYEKTMVEARQFTQRTFVPYIYR